MKYISLLLLAFTLSACHRSQPAQVDIFSGLVLNIPFGNNTAESVSGIIGINHNASFVADRFNVANNAMQFVSTDSAYVDFGDLEKVSFDSTNQFTLSCWVKCTDTTNFMAVLSKRNPPGPWEYSIDSHFGKTGFTMDNWNAGGGYSVYGIDPLKAFAPINVGQWQHLCYVADGSSLKIYVNGTLQSGMDLRNSGQVFVNTTASFVVGNGGAYNKNHYFNGCIDDIRIYNKAVSNDVIAYLAAH